MKTTLLHWLGHSFIVASVTLLAGCANESPVGVKLRPTFPLQPSASQLDLGTCGDLAAPAGSAFAFHVYAKGVQIYRWNGTSWIFVGPSAKLYADAEGNSLVGTHSSGPTWQSLSGSKVVGTVLKRCTSDPNAIQWLLLGAVSAEGPGVFDHVSSIQRVNTVGGLVPSGPGSFSGEEASVPYTAEYYFYRMP